LRFKDVYGDSEEENMFLPTLEEYLDVCIRYDKQAVLELKNKMQPQEVLAIARVVQEKGWLERTTFISFSGENLLELRKGFPTADAQFLVEKASDEEIAFMLENRLGGDFRWDKVKKKTVKRLHDAGLKVNCWTVDDKGCARWLKRCGVDFITSNILE